MSARDKIDFLDKSLRYGYRNYLYFIATDDPAINISRVEIRVKAKGHDVPEKKIRSRYNALSKIYGTQLDLPTELIYMIIRVKKQLS
jgi:predicted ABC-type ATPase